MRISQTNPFSKLHLKSQQLKQSDAIRKSILDVSQLPTLASFLQKKMSKPPYKWQKRWVIVHESYILWNKRKRYIDDINNLSERNQFNGYININSITGIDIVKKSKSQNQFVITAKRKYIFKCASKKDRDIWINGIKQYQNYNNAISKYLGTK